MRKFFKKCWNKVKSFFRATSEVVANQIKEPFSFLKIAGFGVATFAVSFALAYVSAIVALYVAYATGSALLTYMTFIVLYGLSITGVVMGTTHLIDSAYDNYEYQIAETKPKLVQTATGYTIPFVL